MGLLIAFYDGVKGALRMAVTIASSFAGAVLGFAILLGSIWRFWLSLAAIKYLLG